VWLVARRRAARCSWCRGFAQGAAAHVVARVERRLETAHGPAAYNTLHQRQRRQRRRSRRRRYLPMRYAREFCRPKETFFFCVGYKHQRVFFLVNRRWKRRSGHGRRWRRWRRWRRRRWRRGGARAVPHLRQARGRTGRPSGDGPRHESVPRGRWRARRSPAARRVASPVPAGPHARSPHTPHAREPLRPVDVGARGGRGAGGQPQPLRRAADAPARIRRCLGGERWQRHESWHGPRHGPRRWQRHESWHGPRHGPRRWQRYESWHGPRRWQRHGRWHGPR
jgi:hypothetical protein